MRKMKKVVALMLAMMTTVGMLAGCGNANQEAVKKPTEETKMSEQIETKESTEVAVDEEPVEITIMANFGELGGAGKKWFEQIEEALNIKINWYLPAKSAYEESLQLMLINDGKPDVVMLPDTWLTSVAFLEACEYEMFMDISELLPDYKDLMAHTSDVSWQALDVFGDGRIWGVPRSTMLRADGFNLREQWLENLNIDYTEGDFLTADEYFDILYAFTYDDPDGNGVDDTYGLKAYTDAKGVMQTGLSQIFGIGGLDSWQEYDGEYMCLKYSQTASNFKDYLTFANKCWEAGVMEPDAFSIDSTVSTERWNKCMYGSKNEFPGNMDIEVKDVSPQTYVYVPGVVANEGDTYGFAAYSTGMYSYWAITSECERPDKVLAFFDYILSDEQWVNLSAKSLEGVVFTIDENGNYDFSLKDSLTDDEKNTHPIGDVVRRSDGPEYYISKSLPADQQKRISNLIDIARSLYTPALDRGYKPEIASDPVFIEYTSYMNDEINRIIAGEIPVDKWDEILQGWYDAGGTEYVAEMQAYIASLEK